MDLAWHADAWNRGPHRLMPVFGLVCQTISPEIRYRTITRMRLMALDSAVRTQTLQQLYDDNAARLGTALEYCASHAIGMYRLPTGLFPFMDHEAGEDLMRSSTIRARLRGIGAVARRVGIRLVTHPDQYVVLNSERPEVVRNSVRVLRAQAKLLDMLGLPRTPWAAITLHGGKGGRSHELRRAIARLPISIRSRLVLENDERAYGARDVVAICRDARIPMVFDAHHHLVKERLGSYDDPSVARYTSAAAKTWDPKSFQIVHISNGSGSLHDIRHSDFVETLPRTFLRVPYIEVEAKAKEEAVFALRTRALHAAG